jgi:Skp family chaperone for outer membrane proteins
MVDMDNAPLHKNRINYCLLIILSVIFCESQLVLATNGESSTYFSLQVSSFRKLTNAKKDISRFRGMGYEGFHKKVDLREKGEWYRVYIGRFKDRESARLFSKELMETGIIKYAMVHEFNYIDEIGVFDISRIMRESIAGKKASSKYRKYLMEKQALFKSYREEVLEKGKESLSEDERNDLLRIKKEFEDDLKKKNNDIREQILNDIKMIIKSFCEEKNFRILLEDNAVIVVDKGVDVTDRIIEYYDNEMGQ